jgi:hypothetical protein
MHHCTVTWDALRGQGGLDCGGEQGHCSRHYNRAVYHSLHCNRSMRQCVAPMARGSGATEALA